MNKYRELIWSIYQTFPTNTNIEITITIDRKGAREFQEAIYEEVKGLSIVIDPTIIDKNYNEKSFTEVTFPLLGTIKLNIED